MLVSISMLIILDITFQKEEKQVCLPSTTMSLSVDARPTPTISSHTADAKDACSKDDTCAMFFGWCEIIANWNSCTQDSKTQTQTSTHSTYCLYIKKIS